MAPVLAAAAFALAFAGCRSGTTPTDAGTPPQDAGPDPGDGGDGGDGGGLPDGGEPDGGAGAGLTVLDWRAVRSDPLEIAVHEVGLEDELYAATSDGYVVRTGCDAGLCDYRWLDRDGGVRRTGSGWRAAFSSSPVAPDARTLSLIQPQVQSSCDAQGTQVSRFEGDGLLVDVDSGDALATVSPYVTHGLAETHFTSAGGWYRLFFQQDGICGQVAEELRRTTAPFDNALPAGWVVEQELPDGRWVVVRDRGLRVGLAHPDVPGSYADLATEMQDLIVDGGWVYVFSHAPVQTVTAHAPSGARLSWAISLDEEWYALGASGRWVILSGRQDLATRSWPYRVHDMIGQFADVDLRFKGLRRGEGLALLGASDLLVSTAADAEGAQPAQLIDLRTGARDVVSDRKMTAVLVGNDEAAVLYDEARAVLVERGGRTELAGGPITEVYALGHRDSPFALPQRDLALLVRSVATGQYALDALNLRTRRLVTLTEWLNWAPQFGWGLADESCGRPWVTRAVGSGAETTIAPSSTLHFLEYSPATGGSLLVMPADLLSPPRELAKPIPVHCHAPLVSRDGRHAAALIDGYDTQPRRRVVSALLGP